MYVSDRTLDPSTEPIVDTCVRRRRRMCNIINNVCCMHVHMYYTYTYIVDRRSSLVCSDDTRNVHTQYNMIV